MTRDACRVELLKQETASPSRRRIDVHTRGMEHVDMPPLTYANGFAALNR